MAVTAADVALWGRFPAPVGDEGALLDGIVAAVTAHIIDHYDVPDDPDEFTAVHDQAVKLQAARLYKRRDTPEGRSAFGGDTAVTITAVDVDVQMLLSPRFGIA